MSFRGISMDSSPWNHHRFPLPAPPSLLTWPFYNRFSDVSSAYWLKWWRGNPEVIVFNSIQTAFYSQQIWLAGTHVLRTSSSFSTFLHPSTGDFCEEGTQFFFQPNRNSSDSEGRCAIKRLAPDCSLTRPTRPGKLTVCYWKWPFIVDFPF